MTTIDLTTESDHGECDFVVIANRLPVRRSSDGGWVAAPGGLVTAMEPVMRRRAAAWIGWDGEHDTGTGPFRHENVLLVPLPLTADELDAYYRGLANATLWPLYHSGIYEMNVDRRWWRAYEHVNRRFADAAAETAADGATVWVHDYHLQLVPQFLRQQRPDVCIGFFLHTPFPPAELFQRLPWRSQILEGILGADVVGLQTERDARHLADALGAVLSVEPVEGPGGSTSVTIADRTTHVRAHAISIDTAAVEERAGWDAVAQRVRRLRRQLGEPRAVLLGVDRLDYTKGIDVRLQAFGELLDEGHIDVSEAVFVQIATPSRPDVSGYRDVRDRVDQLVGDINGTHGRLGRPAVHYLRRNHSFDELVAYYRLADVMMVTPYRDGMNLVAKEYVACRTDGTGALVLSEFAGAADELGGALTCNPYDVDGVKRAMLTALRLPEAEQRARMEPMRHHLRTRDVHHWAATFLEALGAMRVAGG